MELHQSITLEPATARRIRRAIKNQPISQAAIARKCGLLPQNLANVLAGARPINSERLSTLGRLIGLKIAVKLVVTIEPVTT